MPSALGLLERVIAWGLVLGAGVAVLGVTAPSPAISAPRGCQNSGQTLGVSRVVEVDTSAGPHFGHQQYKDIELLAPGEIVLTFDDGPLRPHTQPILDALDAQCTKATFFMVGSQALADPDMVKQVIKRGHTVGNHTWSHANLRKSTPLKARQEIELGLSAVTAAAGQPVAPFFRFPYLADTKAMLGYTQTRGMGVFSIEIDSQDWKTKNAEAVHRDVLSQLAETGKGIILFHDIQPATAHALPGLLEALRVKGYRVVHLKPKAIATTVPEFDALARDGKARNQVIASAQPLAKRSMTWGSAQPAVTAKLPVQGGSTQASTQFGVPTGQSAGGSSFATTTRSAGANRTALAPSPTTGVGAPPPGLSNQPLAGIPVGVPAPVGDPSLLPYSRLARQRTPAAEDWRDRVFNR